MDSSSALRGTKPLKKNKSHPQPFPWVGPASAASKAGLCHRGAGGEHGATPAPSLVPQPGHAAPLGVHSQQRWVRVRTTSLLLREASDCCRCVAPPASASAPTGGQGAEGEPGTAARSTARCSSRGKGPFRKCACRDGQHIK